MEKVNCGFCGSAFSSTEKKCPICGYPQNWNEKSMNADIALEDEFAFLNEVEFPQRKNKPIFNYDEVNADGDDNQDEEGGEDESYEEDEEEYGSNAVLVVILVVIITLLLLATGFVFFRYFLPNITDAEETTLPASVDITMETEEPTIPTVPCKMLAMTSEAAKLNREGQPWLIHVTVTPENTTDELIYISEDESVATVSEGGKVVAVGEGETIIKIICGEQMIKCPVVVDYDMVIDETGQASVPTIGVDETEDSSVPTDADVEEETKESDNSQETEEAAAEESVPKEKILKLKESDISLSKTRGITYELTLDCDIAADQVEWITMNSNVLLVKDGVITVMGPGTTKVVAKYNGQSAECIVRCVF